MTDAGKAGGDGGRYGGGGMTKYIEVSGEKYREAAYKQPIAPDREGGICAQCAFFSDMAQCGFVIDSSPAVFGGDCAERDVIYVREVAA
jgi:hypothetical protein